MNIITKTLIFSFLFLGLTACDSSSGDNSPTVDVTGRWSGTVTIGADPSSISFTMRQDGSGVTAVDSDGDNWVGSVSGNELELATSTSVGADVASAEVSGVVGETSMFLSGSTEGTLGGVNLNAPVTINLTRK